MAKRTFKTGLDVHIDKGTKWNHMEKTYKKVKCQETGRYMLEEDGEIDVREYIQKFRDQTDINNYIKTNDLGEVVAVHEINKSKAHYGNFTDVPETRAEMIDTINSGKKLGKWLENKQKEELAKLRKNEEEAKKLKEESKTDKKDKKEGDK